MFKVCHERILNAILSLFPLVSVFLAFCTLANTYSLLCIYTPSCAQPSNHIDPQPSTSSLSLQSISTSLGTWPRFTLFLQSQTRLKQTAQQHIAVILPYQLNKMHFQFLSTVIFIVLQLQALTGAHPINRAAVNSSPHPLAFRHCFTIYYTN